MTHVIEEFDKFLTSKNLKFEATILGGAALNILRITSRFTSDVDCITPNLPKEIKEASSEFQKMRKDLKLIPDWLNNGPDQLVRELPDGWESRIVLGFKGESLTIYILGRPDLLKTKLFAFCDRTNPDYEDLLELKPTREELSDSILWVKDRDANPDWPANVEQNFILLRENLYG